MTTDASHIASNRQHRLSDQVLANTFKTQVRDITRRTRGISLPQLIEELRPYLIGWRGYFGFCPTPRVLTNLEAWIRRRLRSYLWRQWQNGHNRFNELRRRGVPKFNAAVAPVRRPVSGACPDTRRSNRPCATTISTHSVSPTPCLCRNLTQSNRRGTRPVCPVLWEGWHREVSPYPDQ